MHSQNILSIKLLKIIFISLLLATACGSASLNQDPILKDPILAAELLEMMKIDQQIMGEENEEIKNAVILKNTARLKEIVSTQGWPTISQVGKKGAQAAWLIAQHADDDVEFQKDVIFRMTQLAKTDEVIPGNLAYMVDRVRLKESDVQTYGTQGQCKEHVFQPFSIEDPDDVDVRRAKMKLTSLNEYISFASKAMCK